jgi:hypothetical protein
MLPDNTSARSLGATQITFSVFFAQSGAKVTATDESGVALVVGAVDAKRTRIVHLVSKYPLPFP